MNARKTLFNRFCLAVVFLSLLVTSNPCLTTAQTPTATLTLIPATLKLAPGESADVLVMLTNPLTTTLQGMSLFWLGDAGVDVAIKPPAVNTLAPQGTAAWRLTVTKQTNGVAGGTLYLHLAYTTTVANQPVAGVSVSTLDIQERPLESLENIVQARLETALETVQERRIGYVYLVLNNVTTVPITITQVHINKPSFVNITPPEKPRLPMALAPQQAVVLEYQVEGAERVQAGKHILVFMTDLTWQRGTQTLHATLPISHKFTVGVLGESEILTAIGVPSFLLLPGFLMVAAFRFLKIRVYPKESDALELKSPEFWMIAVFLSSLAAVVYPYLTAWIAWLGPPRDYLSGYGLRDIMIVWCGSVLAGALAWSAWYSGKGLYRWTLFRNVPTENDTELQTIQKLAGNKMGIVLEQVVIQIGKEKQRVFLLERPRVNRSKVWVAPAIRYRIMSKEDEQMITAFTTLLDQDNPSAMAKMMRQGINLGILKFEWEKTGVLHSPAEVEKSAIVERLGRQRILSEAE